MGYTNSRNETVLCCDAQSIKVIVFAFSSAIERKVLEPRTHYDPEGRREEVRGEVCFPKVYTNRRDHENKGSLSFDVQTTGIHYIIAVTCAFCVSTNCRCDNRIGVVRFEGDYDVVNPFGKLPAQTYGLLPFTGMLFLVYAVLLFWWLFMCIKYAKELMSVHIIVLTILGCFVLDMGVKLIYLTVYNRVGHPVFFLAILSIVIDCSTRTLTRILTLFVCMG